MRGYYVGKLSGERLRRCYDIASPRVKQYLAAEIRFVLRQALRVARPGGRVLFSTYSAHFWVDRLRWFEAQAAAEP